ncbi:hypothetical protein ACHAPJ_010999 [Fusarium lateritium]
MADPDDDPEHKGPTIAASANECLESFQKCLFRATSIHPRELSMVEDQVARFSSWATGIGVFAPGSASMDHRLRYAPEVQSVVTGLLESLNYRCQVCLDILTSIVTSLETDVKYVPGEELPKSLIDVASEISRLNKVSNTIRRASKDTQALKASNFQIKDDEGHDVEPVLLEHFARHIGDRFPNLGEIIKQRLAHTMLLRRKRILYRRHRQGSASIRPPDTISAAPVTLPDAKSGAPSVQPRTTQPRTQSTVPRAATTAPSQIQSATTLAPEKFKMAASSPSVISASKTVALGNHEDLVFPPAPGFAVKKRYEQLKSRRIAENEHKLESGEAEPSDKPTLQELLINDLQSLGEITCPYCLYTLPAQQVFDERKWQNHVKNDLDPYVCLFEDCEQPDVLYNHSDEWLNHLQKHRRYWRCTSHRDLEPFSSSTEYITHMRQSHATKLSDNQLRVMANRNSRKMSKLFPSCPLCGKEDTEIDGRLEDHLAGHLRSIALKSLPSYQDEMPDDVENENNSIDVSRPRSRSTVINLREDEDYVPLSLFSSQDFWDRLKPPLPPLVWSNFLGEAQTDLDLTSNAAGLASISFDTYSFQHSPNSFEFDPIIQNMLQRKMYSQQTEDDGSNKDPNATMGASIRVSNDEQDILPTVDVSAMDSIVGPIANLLAADKKDQKVGSDLVEEVHESQYGVFVDEVETPVVNVRKRSGSKSETNPWDEGGTMRTLIVSILQVRRVKLSEPEDDEPKTEVVICEVTFGDQKFRLELYLLGEIAYECYEEIPMSFRALSSTKDRLTFSILTADQPHRLIGENSISVQECLEKAYMRILPLNMKHKHFGYHMTIHVRGQTGEDESVDTSVMSSNPSQSGTVHSLKASEGDLDDDFEADDEASYRTYKKTGRGSESGKKKKQSSGIYVNGQRILHPRERRVIVDQQPPVTRVPYNTPEWNVLPFTAETDPQRRPMLFEGQPSSDGGLGLEGVELYNRQGSSSSKGSQDGGEAHMMRGELLDETQETREDDNQRLREPNSGLNTASHTGDLPVRPRADSDEEARIRQLRRRKKRRSGEDERIRLRIAEANAKIASRPLAPVPPAPRRSADEVDDHQAELAKELRLLAFEEERREDKARRLARREEKKEEEAQRQRLRERMQPQRRMTIGAESRRQSENYEPGVYRFE